MSTIERGRRVTLSYKEDAKTKRATLVIEISAGSDILPHEHRDDIRNVAAELLKVPVAALDGVDIEMKRVPGDHSHDHDHAHDHDHDHGHAAKSDPPPREPQKA